MTEHRVSRWGALAVSMWLVAPAAGAQAPATQAPATPTKQAPATQAPTTQAPFEPKVGQAGKDVVWVPTPQALVDKMLDMAKVTPQDYLIDLGSGDGRTVITAAKRGLHALGIEYNPEMVALAKRNAAEAKVSDKATFVKADIFESDYSKATVITLFLLPQLNLKLRPTLLDLKPGTRIVSNSFTMDDWQPDETATITDGCTSWCTALFWVVPAKVEGTWRLGNADLVLTQQFQKLSGTLGGTPISEASLKGDAIAFTVGTAKYTGRVAGNAMQGNVAGGSGATWSATRH
jgi:SAM-dependent methyltransferase